MPMYSMKAPDGNTYQIPGPEGASDDQVRAAILAQHPNAGSAPTAPPPPAPGFFDSTPAGDQLQSRLQAPATGVNSMIAHTLGFPVDAGTSLVNLGRTLAGQPRVPLSSQAYGGDWFEHQLNKMGVQTTPDNPNDPVQRYGAAAGQVAPALASGNLGTGMRALAGAFGSQWLSDNGHPDAALVTGVLSNKTGLSDVTAAGAKAALGRLERTADPTVQQGVQDAQATSPGLQTVAQTAGRPFLVKTGAGAAGATTQTATKGIVDSLTKGLTDQAASLAPLGVDTPAVAGKVQEAIAAKDKTIADRQDKVYTAGRKIAAADPAVVPTTNTVAAVDQMLAEAQNPRVLSPPVVSERLQGLAEALRSGDTSWGDFYDLRKQINTLYDTVPKDQITPALDATFARLKQGYYADLAAARDSPGKQATIKANEVYAGLADKRQELHNSVVASILGKDGKTSIANPDQVLDRMVTMAPEAQNYARSMLQQYAPDVLDNLRSYAITKSVEDASRGAHPTSISGTNASKLTPGELADSGLFTPAQAAELRSRQAALNTALNALPEKAPQSNQDISAQSVGRVVGGGFSPTFVGGMLANLVSGGKIERALNTPEGRNKILAGAAGKSSDVQTAVRAYTAALMAQVQQERNEAKQQQASGQPQN